MSLNEALERVLRAPTAKDLWALRSELLAAGVPSESGVWAVLEEFHHYLDHLVTGTSSREYSELASKLDISAVSGVVLEHLLETEESGELATRLLTAVMSEGLMMLATRQHVRAWEGELAAVHRAAAWFLYGEMWRWAESRRPELPASERGRLLDRLFEPVREDGGSGPATALLLGLLFQTVLVGHLTRDLPSPSSTEKS